MYITNDNNIHIEIIKNIRVTCFIYIKNYFAIIHCIKSYILIIIVFFLGYFFYTLSYVSLSVFFSLLYIIWNTYIYVCMIYFIYYVNTMLLDTWIFIVMSTYSSKINKLLLLSTIHIELLNVLLNISSSHCTFSMIK